MANRPVARGKKTPGRGRSIVAIVLLVGLLVMTGIIWRRAIGYDEARALRVLDQKRVQLDGERARLESAIRLASGRSHLQPIAEQRLGMHVPADSEVVILPAPAPARVDSSAQR